uniref:Uncharacterized protein n=1 Tax=Oryza punctata TaxID=4537 RepID=A0A0E0MPN5_ORYPU
MAIDAADQRNHHTSIDRSVLGFIGNQPTNQPHSYSEKGGRKGKTESSKRRGWRVARAIPVALAPILLISIDDESATHPPPPPRRNGRRNHRNRVAAAAAQLLAEGAEAVRGNVAAGGRWAPVASQPRICGGERECGPTGQWGRAERPMGRGLVGEHLVLLLAGRRGRLLLPPWPCPKRQAAPPPATITQGVAAAAATARTAMSVQAQQQQVMIGSRPPNCTGSCGPSCSGHCEAVLVRPIHPPKTAPAPAPPSPPRRGRTTGAGAAAPPVKEVGDVGGGNHKPVRWECKGRTAATYRLIGVGSRCKYHVNSGIAELHQQLSEKICQQIAEQEGF